MSRTTATGGAVLIAGGQDLNWLAMHVVQLSFEAEVLEPPELRQAIAGK
ncbi:WYL domain-containing protein [Saccharomonospora sp.]